LRYAPAVAVAGAVFEIDKSACVVMLRLTVDAVLPAEVPPGRLDDGRGVDQGAVHVEERRRGRDNEGIHGLLTLATRA